jgi:predicted RNase H-like HicB family nuclease
MDVRKPAMRYYHGVVHKDADSAWGVHFPDLPGCFSAADDLDSVVSEASDAISLYFEDASLEIVPRSMDAIRREVADDLAAGAFIVLVPYIGAPTAPVRVNISVDGATLAAIDVAAKSRKVTRSAFLAQAARNEIEGRR